jgi:hypothetical protein
MSRQNHVGRPDFMREKPYSLITSGGLGNQGLVCRRLSAIARPDPEVWCISGDGDSDDAGGTANTETGKFEDQYRHFK